MTFREKAIHYLLPLLVLAGTTLVVYSAIYGHQFIPNWDDYPYVLENEAIRGFSLDHLRQAFTSYFVGNYAPVQIVSYMLDYTFWGLSSAGYLFTNVILHTVSGLLFFLLLVRLRFSSVAAFAAAALFLWHPVQVESVAWIAQRKNLLAMVFFLIAFFHYIAYREDGGRRGGHYLLSLAALTLALLSKSVAVIFPLVALLYDICLSPGDKRPRIADKLPYLFLAAIVAGLAVLSQAQDLGGGRRDYPGGTLLSTLYTMLPVPGAYLRDCFFPTDLSPYYMVAIRNVPDAAVFFSSLFLLVLVVLGITLYRRQPRLFFFYLLFFAALLPVSQIVPLIPLKNDRYLYFPLLGFAGLCGESLRLFRERFPRWRTAALPAVAVVLVIFSVSSFRQAKIWQNDVTLWEHAVDQDPENRVGWLLLTKGYTLRGEGAKAMRALDRYRFLREKWGPPRGWEHE